MASVGGWLTGNGDDRQMARQGSGNGIEEGGERGGDGDSDGNKRRMTHDTTGT